MEIKSNTIFIIFKNKTFTAIITEDSDVSYSSSKYSTLKYTKLITTLASRNNQPSIRLVTISELQKTEDNAKSFFTSASQLKMLIVEKSTKVLQNTWPLSVKSTRFLASDAHSTKIS